MAFCYRNRGQKKISRDGIHRNIDRLCSISASSMDGPEKERKVNRAEANEKERRRMQSINKALESLRLLLPDREGPKLSKAAILRKTADYVAQLKLERVRLLKQIIELKKMASVSRHNKPKKIISSQSVGNQQQEQEVPAHAGLTRSLEEDVKREIANLKIQLEREKSVRKMLGEQAKKAQCSYPSDSGTVAVGQTDSRCHSAANATINLSSPSLNDGHPSPVMNLVQKRIAGQLNAQTISEKMGVQEMFLHKPSYEYTSNELCHCSEIVNSKSIPSVCEPTVSTSNPGFLTATIVAEVSSPLPVEIKNKETRQIVFNDRRQNLDTIVQAIMLIEGDQIFRDKAIMPEN